MRYTFGIILSLFFAACQSSAEKTAGSDTTIASSESPNGSTTQACYRRIMSRDTADISLKFSGAQLTGQLAYNFFEKDDNSGQVTGNQQDSILLLQYTFKSEGVTSVREVVFVLRNGTLVEGTGDYNNAGDTLRFAHPSQLTFSGEPFTKVDCPGNF